MHSENCPINIKDISQSRINTSTSHREKRKTQNTKDDTLFNLSLVKSSTKGVLEGQESGFNIKNFEINVI